MESLAVRMEGDGIAVLVLQESLTQQDYLGMRQHVKATLLDQGVIYIVVDLDSVEELPSIAFGVFCSLARDTRRLGGWCRLIHVGSSLRTILRRTHVDQQVSAFETLRQALDFQG